MRLYEPLIPSRYVRLLLACSKVIRPAQRKQVLDAAGIRPAQLEDESALLPAAALDALLSATVAITRRSDIGFELGLAITPQDHGPLSATMLHCSSIAEVMDLHARYSRLMSTIFMVAVRHDPDRSELIYRPAAPFSPLALGLMLEAHAVSAHQALSAMFGGTPAPYEIIFTTARPAHHHRYAELKPARVHFWAEGLPEVRVVLPASMMATPLSWRPSPAVEVDRRKLNELCSRTPASQQWAGWVCALLRAAEHCQPTAADLAALLNVSTHTLARALAREGTSFRELANRTRMERACGLLEQHSDSIARIAHRLGYANSANFTHAFRAQRGITPQAFRQRAQERAGRRSA